MTCSPLLLPGLRSNLLRMVPMAPRGRGRGKHKFGRGRYFGSKFTEEEKATPVKMEPDNAADQGQSSKQSTHPYAMGLRGKAIGMYFARRSKMNKKWVDKNERNEINIDEQMAKEISSILYWLHRNENDSSQFTENDNSFSPMNMFSRDYLAHLLSSKQSTSEENVAESQPLSNLVPIEGLNKILLDEYQEKVSSNKKFQDMQAFRKKLPTYHYKEEIVNLIEANQVVVISGETGSGKTTQIPQYILDHYIVSNKGSSCKVVCTQPRRISAITVAERVAEERDEICGGNNSTGYHIRLMSKLPRTAGSILYCTTGIILQQLESDPYISGASHIILDEIHERDLLADFLIIVLKELLQHRSDLKIILMSATLNAQAFSRYFGNCPMLEIPGKIFPVKIVRLEEALEVTGYKPPSRKSCGPPWIRHMNKKIDTQYRSEMLLPYLRSVEDRYSSNTIMTLKDWDEGRIDLQLIHCLIKYICRTQGDGAILVFLPGWDNISSLNKELTSDPTFNSSTFRVFPLHSLMPTVNQKEVFAKPPPGVRKIILATNIAETSITIDDVVFVIDCGKMKLTKFDVENNITTLNPEWISMANAQQRMGRAGRVQPGVVYRLYTQPREFTFCSYQLPEMLRTRLEEVILKIKLLKLGKAESFLEKALDPPSKEAVKLSLEFLRILNALDENENLTPLGYHLAKLPLDTQTGRMIIMGSIFSCLDPILTIAASLSFKDPFVIPLGKEQLVDQVRKKFAKGSNSDHIMLANVFSEWKRACAYNDDNYFCYDNFLSRSTLQMLKKMKSQFAEYLHNMNFIPTADPESPMLNKNSDNEKLIKAIVCAGLYPNVAKMSHVTTKRRTKISTKSERTVKVHPKCVINGSKMFKSQWLVYYKKMRSSAIYLYDVTNVNPLPLLLFGGRFKQDDSTLVLDDWITFSCTEEVTFIIQNICKELDLLLQKKIFDPECDIWDKAHGHGHLLEAIVKLISKEEPSIPKMPFVLPQLDEPDDADSDQE